MRPFLIESYPNRIPPILDGPSSRCYDGKNWKIFAIRPKRGRALMLFTNSSRFLLDGDKTTAYFQCPFLQLLTIAIA